MITGTLQFGHIPGRWHTHGKVRVVGQNWKTAFRPGARNGPVVRTNAVVIFKNRHLIDRNFIVGGIRPAQGKRHFRNLQWPETKFSSGRNDGLFVVSESRKKLVHHRFSITLQRAVHGQVIGSAGERIRHLLEQKSRIFNLPCLW